MQQNSSIVSQKENMQSSTKTLTIHGGKICLQEIWLGDLTGRFEWKIQVGDLTGRFDWEIRPGVQTGRSNYSWDISQSTPVSIDSTGRSNWEIWLGFDKLDIQLGDPTGRYDWEVRLGGPTETHYSWDTSQSTPVPIVRLPGVQLSTCVQISCPQLHAQWLRQSLSPDKRQICLAWSRVFIQTAKMEMMCTPTT